MHPPDFVPVTGADAAQSGADVLVTLDRGVPDLVLQNMPWHYNMGPIADPESIGNIDPLVGKHLDFGKNRRRVNYDAACNQVEYSRIDDTAWHMVELVDIITDDNGMARIGSSLVPNDQVLAFGKQIDKLALGFVAPLQSNDTLSGHVVLLIWQDPARSRTYNRQM